VPRFTGKERDSESGNDYFGARYYRSSMGRFLSPDPTGGHVEDPQSLNKYSYVGNNPLIRTDPTGLDFNLQCSGGNTATCQGGVQGTTSTDANGKSTFTATVISNDKNGGLVDQNGNKYSATVSGAGVSFSQAGSNSSSMGNICQWNKRNHDPRQRCAFRVYVQLYRQQHGVEYQCKRDVHLQRKL